MKESELDHLYCGERLRHILGPRMNVVKVVTFTKSIGNITKMVECRFLDKNGMFHVQKFYPEEVRHDP